MAKSKFLVEIDRNLFDVKSSKKFQKEHQNLEGDYLLISDCLQIVLKQLEVLERRERTINEYQKWVYDYQECTKQSYINEITTTSIYVWLQSMDALKNSTKNIRLKSLKAVLVRFFENGWIKEKFWKTIQIKVDREVKPSAKEDDVMLLLSTLDLTNWYQLRDAVAIQLMFRTGIRLATMSKLKSIHIDTKKGYLNLSSEIMKNHNPLKLPIDKLTCELIEILQEANQKVLRQNNKRNNLLFITENDTSVQSSMVNNVIQKRIIKYANACGVENVNPHALRRGFATNLMKKKAPIALISKALGHASLETTTQYLYLDREEVAENLKNYL